MKGKVYLVGAGPGDYKLMTLKGLECIRKSDVIVYDRLANIDYLKEAKENCEFINVGKASSNHLLPQDDIMLFTFIELSLVSVFDVPLLLSVSI